MDYYLQYSYNPWKESLYFQIFVLFLYAFHILIKIF